MGDFKKLNVWNKAKDLAVYIYHITKSGAISKDFGLRDQMRRAAVSISANIAEGEQLNSNSQATRHFYIARGSVAELYTQAIIAYEVDYVNREVFEKIEKEYNDISSMITKLIQARAKSPNLKPNTSNLKPNTPNLKPQSPNPKP